MFFDKEIFYYNKRYQFLKRFSRPWQSWVSRAFVHHDMVLPAVFVVWIYGLGAQRTSDRSCWLSLLAVMIGELFSQEHGLALLMVLVLVHRSTFLQQMLFNLFDFDHLLAFPTTG